MSTVPAVQGFYSRSAAHLPWYTAQTVPCAHVIGEGHPYAILTRDFGYVAASGCMTIARIGMPFDGLTIPRLAWRLVGHPWGRYLPAGVIHDHLCYESASDFPGDERNRLRLAADCLFREACLWTVPDAPRAAWIFYRAVRAGALASRYADPAHTYIEDLAGTYRRLGLGHLLPDVQDRRRRRW